VIGRRAWIRRFKDTPRTLFARCATVMGGGGELFNFVFERGHRYMCKNSGLVGKKISKNNKTTYIYRRFLRV